MLQARDCLQTRGCRLTATRLPPCRRVLVSSAIQRDNDRVVLREYRRPHPHDLGCELCLFPNVLV